MAINMSMFSFVLLTFNYAFQTTHSNEHYKHNGTSFRLIYRDILESPFNRSSNLIVEKKLERLIQLSNRRIEYLKHHPGDNSSLSTNAIIRLPLHLQPGHNIILVEVGIGTFSSSSAYKTYYLEMDTGSGVIWTQCEGCNPCFQQRDPFFPKSQSRTYHALPCHQCPPGTICQQNHCTMNEVYVDGTLIQGIAATEKFTFGSNVHGTFLSMQMYFACVIRATNFVRSHGVNNIASGILGMDREASSFVTQAREHFGGRFSYCLAPFDYQGQQPPMFLRFGNDIPHLPSLHHYAHTPLIQGRYPFYYLDLQAISVGSERLNINPNIFQLKPDGLGGCIIDSGSAISYLVNEAYVEFERVLRKKIEVRHPGIRTTSDASRLCYQPPRPGLKPIFPKLTFHFSLDAKFVVQPEAYMLGLSDTNPQVYCLTIMRSTEHYTLLGSSQQVNQHIIYDTINSRLYFAPKNCLSDN